MPNGLSAAGDLGLGANLASQVADETEEERRRRQLGLAQRSDAVSALFGYGRTGVAPMAGMQLGLRSAGRY